MARLCILGPEPGYAALAEPDAAHYKRLFGEGLEIRCWRDPGDLSGFALVMPLLVWGYHHDPARWFALLDAAEAAGVCCANSVALVRWNSDKAYLLDLAARGAGVVPTRLCTSLSTADLDEARDAFGCEALIVKPPLSAGADRTYRLSPAEALPGDVAGAKMLVQPLMAAIASEGEYSLFYFGGAFSHAIVKRPAAGDFRVQSQFGGREESVAPPAAALACAEATLAACAETPLYARVDMVRDGDRFVLMELELIEPSLFLDHAPDGGAMFAAAVLARADS